MSFTSKTGLTASPIKKIYKIEKNPPVQLRAIAKPAPFVLKPLATLYNPYSYGCSLLCNHPTDSEARELLKKAKDVWATEGKNLLLPEEINAIKTGLAQLHINEHNITPRRNEDIPTIESVPEELFRRYTETDSRPVTPAPTLASGATRICGSRRCFTPDPQPTTKVHEKTLLVLDLRRSHSQETFSCLGSSFLDPPLIRIQHVPTRTTSLEDLQSISGNKCREPAGLSAPNINNKRPKSRLAKQAGIDDDPTEDDQQNNFDKIERHEDESIEEEEEFTRRRGKKKRRKGRDSSRSIPPFQNSIDPETQVAAIGDESRNTSARHSLVPASSQDVPDTIENDKQKQLKSESSLDVDSFLDIEILKQLRRELTAEIVELEFNIKRRRALQEALKTVSKDKIDCEQLVKIQKELAIPPVNADMWSSLPRVFSRSSARFELPMDSRTLRTMTPLEYVKKHVGISSTRKLLYNCIFNRFKDDTEGERKLSGKKLQEALDAMMGKPMSEKQRKYIQELVGWKEEQVFDFKTLCGLCALCERLLAAEYCPQLPDKKIDPCQEIETADFEALTRKLKGQDANENLVKVLYGIKNS